ncbi:hypothetical protein Tco_0347384 [Tanacetum coccineum]
MLVTHHHLLTRVPVKLDLEDWNYESWEYFFDQLCLGYNVLKFIRGTPADATPTSRSVPFTPDELKVDKIILSLIFTTISDPLQKRLAVARPNTAKEAWDILTNIVKDNKRTRASTLKTELRSIQLGTLRNGYLRKGAKRKPKTSNRARNGKDKEKDKVLSHPSEENTT